MKRHTVTEEELDDWLNDDQWHHFAASYGSGTEKHFEVNPAAKLYRVMDHGVTCYEGPDKAAAIAAYNEAV